MKIYRAIRAFDWSAAMQATKLLLILVGAIAIFSYLANLHIWMLIGSVLVLAFAWVIAFKLVQGVSAIRKEKTEIRKSTPRREVSDSGSHRRFVYFRDNGEPVYKFESECEA